MNVMSTSPKALIALAALAAPALMPAAGTVAAQELGQVVHNEQDINVVGNIPTDLSGMPAGPDIDGFISARRGSEIQVTTENGSEAVVAISQATDIKARGGLLGLGRTRLGADALINGLPVSVETVQWNGNLVATQVRFSDEDLETATMIRTGTGQRFSENEAMIEENAAATEALRGRVANIDQYNIMGTTNVYFDTGKWNLSGVSEGELCQAAAEAEAMDNALLLVVGYTDSVGDQDYNQVLSERRAGRVVNFLQQECGWQPWRMLTPTGMAESDPMADNSTAAGRAQNRRVSVNILVSKALEGM
ncbi:OmpA family protein [Erythrobacter alti]|uniref:OmpA family protein n=1 Tax=Erythrobacter alti TaxID=1896145 RepID=UPI0030F3F13E